MPDKVGPENTFRRRGHRRERDGQRLLEHPQADAPGVEQHVVDLVAPDLRALLARIDSLRVDVLSGPRRLGTRDARVVPVEMGWRDRVLTSIANPNVAYILLMLGSMGLMMELWNPGAIFPGVVPVDPPFPATCGNPA